MACSWGPLLHAQAVVGGRQRSEAVENGLVGDSECVGGVLSSCAKSLGRSLQPSFDHVSRLVHYAPGKP